MFSKTVCEHFQEVVCDTVEGKWSSYMSVLEMWEVIKARKQPDWFKQSSVVLSELIEKRNALFGKWLSSGANCDQQRYVVQRRLVSSAAKKVKNDWLLKKARSVEAGMLSNCYTTVVLEGV